MANKHVEIEKSTIKKMITIYCRAKHNTRGEVCESCKELINYTELKTDKCVFGDLKPACSSCPIHCYSKNYREKIKEVMRFSGPRMFYLAPRRTILHFLNVFHTKRMLRNNTVKEIIANKKPSKV